MGTTGEGRGCLFAPVRMYPFPPALREAPLGSSFFPEEQVDFSFGRRGGDHSVNPGFPMALFTLAPRRLHSLRRLAEASFSCLQLMAAQVC